MVLHIGQTLVNSSNQLNTQFFPKVCFAGIIQQTRGKKLLNYSCFSSLSLFFLCPLEFNKISWGTTLLPGSNWCPEGHPDSICPRMTIAYGAFVKSKGWGLVQDLSQLGRTGCGCWKSVKHGKIIYDNHRLGDQHPFANLLWKARDSMVKPPKHQRFCCGITTFRGDPWPFLGVPSGEPKTPRHCIGSI